MAARGVQNQSPDLGQIGVLFRAASSAAREGLQDESHPWVPVPRILVVVEVARVAVLHPEVVVVF